MANKEITLPEKSMTWRLGTGAFLYGFYESVDISFEKQNLYKKILFAVILGLGWFLTIFSITTLGMFIWHEITPTEWHFLHQGQVAKIRILLLGISLGAGTFYLSKKIFDGIFK